MSTALILSGGGARAAYQVGVLKAIAEIVPVPRINPFPVICGTSAGAINASLIACQSNHFADSVRRLETLWTGLSSGRVHDIGGSAIAVALWHLLRSAISSSYSTDLPWSLLDNTPLRKLLDKTIDFGTLPARLDAGDVESLVISVLAYKHGKSLSFFQSGRQASGWHRHRRVGYRSTLSMDHLMASAAIPGIYPAVKIRGEYYGDGAIRQSAPLSPALHLGARKLFVIGVSHNPKEGGELPEPSIGGDQPPSLAHMASHFLNGPFIDALEEDMETLLRLNEIAEEIDAEERAALGLSVVDIMCITPSKRFDEIAANHMQSLPASMRFLMKLLGGTRAGGGSSLASYLMFEGPFIRELIDCGYDDAMAQADELARFLSD